MASGTTYYGRSIPCRGQEGNRSFNYDLYAHKIYEYNTAYARRGTCLIINNKHFPTCEGVDDRVGSDADVENLRTTFQRLAFDVQVRQNRTCRNMMDDVERAADDDLNKISDCFVFILMTHGMPEGYYCGVDGQIKLDDLLEKFKDDKCPDSLRGKPKIFIIQGCRGGTKDNGIEVCDAQPMDRPYIIPKDSDKVVIYACSSEREAYRHTGCGSWFIQILCGVLRAHAVNTLAHPPTADRTFMWMMHRVGHVMAHEFDNALAPLPLKQMPQITCNLTKELYFHPKTHQQETGGSGPSAQAFNYIQVDTASG